MTSNGPMVRIGDEAEDMQCVAELRIHSLDGSRALPSQGNATQRQRSKT